MQRVYRQAEIVVFVKRLDHSMKRSASITAPISQRFADASRICPLTPLTLPEDESHH